MALSITVPDLASDNASFDDYFISFGISRQTDGAGGVVYVGTLSIMVFDSSGNEFKVASLSKPIGSTAKSSLRDFIKNQFLPDLKAQEGL